jgi:Flp pilus assembly protein TadD
MTLLAALSFLLLLVPRQATSAQSTSQKQSLLSEAKALFAQDRFTEADQVVRRFLDGQPDSAEAHFLLGHILFRKIQARAVQERQSQSQSQEHGAMANGRNTNFDSSGVLSEEKKELAKASLAEFTAGARLREPSADDLKTVAFDYVLLADYSDADKWLTKMLQWAPGDAEGWYYLGRTKYNENRFDEAAAAFRQCLKLDPQNVKAEDNLGLSLAGLGRVGEAAAAYRDAIAWQEQLEQKDPGPYINLGTLLIDENLLQEAVAALLQATKIAPSEARAHEFLGKAYARLEELSKAQSELETAIELSPRAGNLHCMLAPIYRRQGLSEKARAENETCLRLTEFATSHPE